MINKSNLWFIFFRIKLSKIWSWAYSGIWRRHTITLSNHWSNFTSIGMSHLDWWGKERSHLNKDAILTFNIFQFIISDAEILSKPLVILLGGKSTGKTSLVNYLLGIQGTPWQLKSGERLKLMTNGLKQSIAYWHERFLFGKFCGWKAQLLDHNSPFWPMATITWSLRQLTWPQISNCLACNNLGSISWSTTFKHSKCPSTSFKG